MHRAELVKQLKHLWDVRLKRRDREYIKDAIQEMHKRYFLTKDLKIETLFETVNCFYGFSIALDFCTLFTYANYFSVDSKREQENYLYLNDRLQERPGFYANYYFMFQYAVKLYETSDFQQALFIFRRIKSEGKDTYLKASASFLIICCKDMLDVSFEGDIAFLKNYIAGLDRNFKDYLFQKLDFFSIKNLYREAKYSEILNFPRELYRQPRYYQLAVHLMHYQKLCTPFNRKLIIDEMKECCTEYYKDYMLNTITYNNNHANLKPSNGSIVQRLQYWMKKWLISPASFPAQKTLQALEELEFSKDYDVPLLSSFMLKIILGWSGLFASLELDQINNMLAPLNKQGSKCIYIEYSFELLLIEYFFYFRDHKVEKMRELDLIIKKHPIYKNNELYLADIYDFFNKPENMPDDFKFKTLVKSIHQLRQPEYKREKIYIQSNLNKIVFYNNFNQQETIINEILAKTLLALIKYRDIKKSTLIRSLFQKNEFSNFHEELHASKIPFILTKIRKLDSRIVIKTQGEIISLLEGHDLFEVVELPIYSKQLEDMGFKLPVINLSKQRIPISKTKTPKPINLDDSKSYSRYDLQAMLDKTERTTLRYIAKWKKDKQLKVVGCGRSTRYYLTKNLSDHLAEL